MRLIKTFNGPKQIPWTTSMYKGGTRSYQVKDFDNYILAYDVIWDKALEIRLANPDSRIEGFWK